MENADNLEMLDQPITEVNGVEDGTHQEVEEHDDAVVFVFEVVPTLFEDWEHFILFDGGLGF